LGSNFNPRNTQCIYHARHWLRWRLRIKILARLELKQNWAFFKGLLVTLLLKSPFKQSRALVVWIGTIARAEILD